MHDLRRQLALASEHFRAGRLREAETLLTEILRAQSTCAPALNLLAGIAHRAGDLLKAADLLRRAIAAEPTNPDLYLNLGEALARLGQLADSEAAYRQGLAIAPNLPELHCNLGNVLLARGDVAGALASLARAVSLAPNFAEAHYNLSRAQHAAGELPGAIASLRRAIAIREPFAPAHYNLGTALREAGDLQGALHHLRRAIELRPNYPAALNNLGLILFDLRRVGESAQALREAIRQKPDYAAAWTNLGNALARLRDVRGAVDAHRRAVDLYPTSADLASSLIMSLLYDPDCSPHMHERELERFNGRFAKPITPISVRRTPHRRLRIGYLSSDFRDHVVARNILPLFERHDRSAFDAIAFYNHPRRDSVTECIAQLCSAFHPIHHLSDDAAAALIRSENIDILVDLNVHSRGNRVLLLARKPAPIQITFAGYPGSTGLAAVDFRISDPILDPPGTRHGPEKILHIPSFWCYRPTDPSMPVAPSPFHSTGQITFASLNSPAKLNDALLTLWSRILHNTPDSRLLLLAWDTELRHRITAFFSGLGIAADRIAFSNHIPHDQYLHLYDTVDIVLDPMPYNGHTTSLDALWMGVAVVTLPGLTPVSRGGQSQLTNIGLAELIARDQDD